MMLTQSLVDGKQKAAKTHCRLYLTICFTLHIIKPANKRIFTINVLDDKITKQTIFFVEKVEMTA